MATARHHAATDQTGSEFDASQADNSTRSGVEPIVEGAFQAARGPWNDTPPSCRVWACG